MNKIKALDLILDKLLSPNGCPWDREQTLKTLRKYIIEETYETVDAIDSENYELLKEELGDLLFEILFITKLCEKDDIFDINDVINEVSEKMIRRHPHIFADTEANTSEEVLKNWETIKRKEKNNSSVLGDLPKHLSILHLSKLIQKRMAYAGFDWSKEDIKGVLSKLHEELDEFENALDTYSDDKIEEELGDIVFTIINLSRKIDKDVAVALNKTNKKIVDRFQRMEKYFKEKGIKDISTVDVHDMEIVWNKMKLH